MRTNNTVRPPSDNADRTGPVIVQIHGLLLESASAKPAQILLTTSSENRRNAGRRRIPSSVKPMNSTPARNAGSQTFALGSVIASLNGEVARGLNNRATVLITRGSDGELTVPT